MEGTDNQELILYKEDLLPSFMVKRWQWWSLVVLNIFFLIGGQTAAVLLGRFYYDKGGNSKWMATLVQTAAFPVLLIPLFLLPSQDTSNPTAPPSVKSIILVYFVLGVIIAGDNMLYSVGLLYLTASTYSLICATQLAFNAVFSFFLNSQKFTALILNSVVVLTLAAALLGIDSSSDSLTGVSKSKYAIGFFCTLAASALYSLILSLMQVSFQKVLKKETFSVVLEMQVCTSLVATTLSCVGLFASGEWKTLHREMEGFHTGKVSYILTLAFTAVAWQVASVGVVGLIFVVSSLFSNAISTVGLAVVPIASVIIFHDKMNGIKIIALLLAFWGMATYVYQNYMDDHKAKERHRETDAAEV